VYGSYIDEPVVRKGAGSGGTLYFLHRNQQFSVTAITNSSAGVVERYAYQAYGEPTITDGSGSVMSSSSINNRYTYTGREWDGTVGLYHFRARWMSGLTGRFLTRDPIGYASGSRNIYSLFRNRCLDKVDPSGKQDCDTPDKPTVISAPRNRASVSSMPWINTQLPSGTYGITIPSISPFCNCAECCDGSFYISSFGVDITIHIFLDIRQMLGDGVPWEHRDSPLRQSVEGTYGHEQMHVINILNSIPGLEQQTNVVGRVFATRRECEERCNRYKLIWTRLWTTTIQADTGHTDPNRVPLPGTDYPPIGTMPNPTRGPQPVP
jgi:RHS repeat-associated protein